MAKFLQDLRDAVDRNTVAVDAAVAKIGEIPVVDFEEFVIKIDANSEKLMIAIAPPAPEEPPAE